MGIRAAVNSEAGVTLSRLSMIIMPLLLIGLIAVLSFAVNGKLDDLSRTEDRVTQVENSMSDLKSKIDVLNSTNDVSRTDRQASQASTSQTLSDIKADVSKVNSNVSTLTANVAAMAATLDLLKQRFVANANRYSSPPLAGYNLADRP